MEWRGHFFFVFVLCKCLLKKWKRVVSAFCIKQQFIDLAGAPFRFFTPALIARIGVLLGWENTGGSFLQSTTKNNADGDT
jgi:hypothetical protein